MKPLIGIIADDLTGANDSGIHLTANGISTSVYLDVPKSEIDLSSGIVIDTNSRTLEKNSAKHITKRAGRFLQKVGCKYIYKKVDSTLRGHIGIELVALKDVLKPEFVIIAPAFPEYGRITINGIHYLYGEKLTNTEVLMDPHFYERESNIINILSRVVKEPIGLLKKEHIDSNLISDKIKEFKNDGVKWLVSDAETEGDLKEVVAAITNISNNVLWVGSAGLIKALMENIKGKKVLNKSRLNNSFASQVIVVSGSFSKVSKSQIDYAIQYSNVSSIAIDIGDILEKNWGKLISEYKNKCLTELNKGHDIILYLKVNQFTKEQIKKFSNRMKKSPIEIGDWISNALVNLVKSVLEMHNVNSGLILTGGKTESVKYLREVSLTFDFSFVFSFQ